MLLMANDPDRTLQSHSIREPDARSVAQGRPAILGNGLRDGVGIETVPAGAVVIDEEVTPPAPDVDGQICACVQRVEPAVPGCHPACKRFISACGIDVDDTRQSFTAPEGG